MTAAIHGICTVDNGPDKTMPGQWEIQPDKAEDYSDQIPYEWRELTPTMPGAWFQRQSPLQWASREDTRCTFADLDVPFEVVEDET